ncbi:DUF305 domain-containing protein [Pontibacter sp. 172403-2]|uniref:DUF305 domain-containing protein n=1 Tax=Pontibacter rufus TaxID=2791028 RepID=UPI0018AFF797|nr:DUF305 domain-containing protein [Pontibacter sp. 172403-2]MBF9252180.1 DUF305 domain-containing protein [Pontibacter sp. 172403-2]
MNKLKIYTLLLLTALLSAACDKEDGEIDPSGMAFHAEMKAAAEKMQQAMDSVEMTMDPDVDFARLMIPHHQGSIDMSNIVLKYAKHEELKQLAQEALENDSKSQGRLQAFLDAHGAPKPETDSSFGQEMMQAMTKMNQTMQAYNMSNDPDYDYAMMMTFHHQGAIDMSNIELKHGHEQAMLDEARTIIEAQEQEIIDLAKFRNEHGQP